MRVLRTPFFTRAAVLSLIALAAAHFAYADLVIFKDGFVLHGKVARKGTTITDPLSGISLSVQEGAFFVLDGARNIQFSFSQVQDVDDKDLEKEADIVKAARPLSRLNTLPMIPAFQVMGASEFKGWDRALTIESVKQGKPYRFDIKQRLGMVTPQYVRIDAREYNWSSYHLTSEFTPEVLRSLLMAHADFKSKGGSEDIPKFYRIATFFTQGRWYDAAEEELDRVLKQFPEEKEKVHEKKNHIKHLRTWQKVDDIERAFKVGQHDFAQKEIASLPKEGMDEKLRSRANDVASKYETANEQIKSAKTFLKDLPNRVVLASEKKLFEEAVKAIHDEITLDNVGRLEAFLSFSQQVEREIKQGKTPEYGGSQLLSLAVTGWAMGKDSAEAKYEAATRLWRARTLALELLRSENEIKRGQLIADYQKLKKADQIGIDEMAQIISLLPPTEPEKDISSEPVEMTVGNEKRGRSYLLQLPPEYSHGRAYPILFLLRNSGEKPKELLEKFSALGAQHGYILVAPEWGTSTDAVYTYSSDEHGAVLDVLRDLRRRFQVDSDRVFLFGYGEGANMAADVGLSHPDLFAGVMPMSGWINHHAYRYVTNAQHLPLFVIGGSQCGEMTIRTRDVFKQKWLPRNYPTIYSEYKGRGPEYFSGEPPILFDWMNRKKRAFPSQDLGRQDFCSLRETDNSFYWITIDQLFPRNICNDTRKVSSASPGMLQARITEGNNINLDCRGIKQLTIWLGKDMIDFAKPVNIRFAGGKAKKYEVQPNLEVLLEDFGRRGDRQRLFVARIDLGY